MSIQLTFFFIRRWKALAARSFGQFLACCLKALRGCAAGTERTASKGFFWFSRACPDTRVSTSRFISLLCASTYSSTEPGHVTSTMTIFLDLATSHQQNTIPRFPMSTISPTLCKGSSLRSCPFKCSLIQLRSMSELDAWAGREGSVGGFVWGRTGKRFRSCKESNGSTNCARGFVRNWRSKWIQMALGVMSPVGHLFLRRTNTFLSS